MKMLTRSGEKEHLISLKERLEDNGIPAVIQGEETARMTIPRFLLEPTLWIYIDDQLEDAVKLIDDPNHIVSTGIDIDLFYETALSETAQKKALNEGLKHIAIYIGAIIIGMFFIIKVLERIAS